MESIKVSWDEAYLPGIHRKDGKAVQYNIGIPSLFERDELFTLVSVAPVPPSDYGFFLNQAETALKGLR